MKKRIFSSLFAMTIISLLACSIALCLVFYGQLSTAVQDEVRERAAMLKETITPDNYEALTIADMRLTVVAADGAVLYDDDQNANTLPNHANREEISEARLSGTGESRRFSDTLGQETYYYAIRLDDGSVLRLAKTMSSIFGVFGGAIPIVSVVVLAMLAIGYVLARSLTRRIIAPINKVNLDEKLTAPYDELAPFVQTISKQRACIARQISDLQSRADTIAAIMDSMSEGVIFLDKQGAVLSINKSAAGLFASHTAVDGKNILEVLRDVELNEAMRSALSGVRGEMNLSHDNKTYHVYFSPVAWASSKAHSAVRPAPVTDSGAIILFLDITEKSMAEKLRREFSANVSHELKTPLTTIYGNVEMLENGMVKAADTAQFYGKIKDEAARLIALIEDILMLSQLDENSAALVTENVDLAAVAAEVAQSLAPKAKAQNVTAAISGIGTLSANRSQMTELFYNLIDNAIKYNKPGGTVRIDISSTPNGAKIAVTDTGIGIPQELQSRVFERFYRVDKSHSKKTGGTGLGLAIVKHIVMAYGGAIELQSGVDEGTRVTVLLEDMFDA